MIASTNAWSPAARTCLTYGAGSIPVAAATCSAAVTASAFDACDRSTPTSTTGRLVTMALPSPPVMSPRAPTTVVASRTVVSVRLGSTTERAQVTAQSEPEPVSSASDS